MFRLNKFLEGEQYFRQSVELSEKLSPDSWETYNRKSYLGEYVFLVAGKLKANDAEAAEKKMAEAEGILVSSYEELRARAIKLPKQWQVRVPEAIERLVRLYEAWEKPTEAAKWRTELKIVRDEQAQ